MMSIFLFQTKSLSEELERCMKQSIKVCNNAMSSQRLVHGGACLFTSLICNLTQVIRYCGLHWYSVDNGSHSLLPWPRSMIRFCVFSAVDRLTYLKIQKYSLFHSSFIIHQLWPYQLKPLSTPQGLDDVITRALISTLLDNIPPDIVVSSQGHAWHTRREPSQDFLVSRRSLVIWFCRPSFRGFVIFTQIIIWGYFCRSDRLQNVTLLLMLKQQNVIGSFNVKTIKCRH